MFEGQLQAVLRRLGFSDVLTQLVEESAADTDGMWQWICKWVRVCGPHLKRAEDIERARRH
jgi:hypothetical protein